MLPGTLLAARLLLFTERLGIATSSGPDDPPPRCFRANDLGELPTCTYSNGRWERSFDPGFGNDPLSPLSPAGPDAAFGVLFLLVLAVGVAVAVWKVSTARRMARDSGMSERDATTMALLTDDGFEATYLAANLRGQTSPPVPGPGGGRTVAERLRELDALRAEGLLSDEEHERGRRAVLDDL